jgi:N,N'-diacetyllegionaminate synthase
MIQIIAEIAQAHDGSLGLLHSYIDVLSKAGVDAVKFQTHIAEAESSEFELFRVNFSYVDATRFDYWKRMEFTKEQWAGIKQHCDEVGVEFMSSPFSIAAIELLEQLQVKRYKVGSGEVSNLLLLERMATTGKPVILSSGMSDWSELDIAVGFLRDKNVDVSILQCTTAYPTPPEKWGLSVIQKLKERFGIPVGFSDHSGTTTACLAAAALGAEILEFHAVFDRTMFGPDAKASLEIDEIAQLVTGVRQIEKALQPYTAKENASSFSELKVMFGKSLAINKAMNVGQTIQLCDLESKKPANKGIPASDFRKVIGKKLCVEKGQWSFLNWTDMD